jgi:N-acetylglucosaminyldiphosphoundecaprenol N-acetyl-beta-D-mannosaminyltransferase
MPGQTNAPAIGADRLGQRDLQADCYHRFSAPGLWRQRFRRLALGIFWKLLTRAASGTKRLLDLTGAAVLLLALWPVLVLTAVLLLLRGDRQVLERAPRMGRWCQRFPLYGFALPPGRTGRLLAGLHLHRLPVLFNVLKGHMSFIGPRPAPPGELDPRDRAARRRYDIRPGLVCLWWIRRRANIAYETETEADLEYVDTRSAWGDLGIALRSLPSLLYGAGGAPAPERLAVLDLPIDNLTMEEAVQAIVERMNSDRPCQICFVNAHCANIARRDRAYCQVLKGAELRLADGIGMKLAGKLLGREVRQNVNGTDLFPRLCAALKDSGKGVFLLGARPGVAEGARDWVAAHCPGVRIAGCYHGYFSQEEEEAVVWRIAASGADLLLVAMGAPRQEKWIGRHLPRTGARVAMGVGGLFDFYSGRIPRAPLWMREMGLEWFYRFCREPRRMWKRYFVGNAVFLFRVILARVREVHLGKGTATQGEGVERADLRQASRTVSAEKRETL